MTQMQKLAQACVDGACNIRGIVRSMGEAIQEIPFGQPGNSGIELKMVIGQVSYLLGESAGPTQKALEAWNELHQEPATEGK